MCKRCKIVSSFRESSRVHGSPPKRFFICSNCGEEVQGTYASDGSVRDFSTSRYKGGSNPVSLRLSDSQYEFFLSLGITSREVFESGLEKYKNNPK